MAGFDEEEWVRQFQAIEKPLYNVVYRYLWDASESEDIVQDAFLRCWRIREKIELHGFRSLVFKTALRLASNKRRRKRVWQLLPLTEEAHGGETSDSQDALLSRILREAIDSLPEPYRRVVLLSELVGMSHTEIASILDVRPGTVGSRRNRALAALRDRLQAKGITWDES